MPLPELNTQGPDITNTLLKIEQIKNARLNQAHIEKQNALLDLQTSPEVRELSRRKALQELKQHEEEVKDKAVTRQKEILGLISNYVAKINPDIPGDYEKAVEFMVKDPTLQANPVLFPDKSIFEKEDINSPTGKVLDKDMLRNWQKSMTRTAADLQKDPNKDIESVTVYRPGGTAFKHFVSKKESGYFDPEAVYGKGFSVAAPKEAKEPVETWGAEETLSSGEKVQRSSRGKVNVITKPEKEDKEDKALVPVKLPDGRVVYERRSKAVGKEAPSSGKEGGSKPKVKRLFTSDGQTVRELVGPDGTEFQVMDQDGEWIKAPKTVVDKIGSIPRAPGEFERSVTEALGPEKKVEKKEYSKRAVNAQGVEIGWTGTQWEDVKTGKVYR